jgi:MraZ protein
LPPSLREYAELDKEIVLVGQGKKLELWSKSMWEGRRDEYLDMVSQSDQLPEELMSISL